MCLSGPTFRPRSVPGGALMAAPRLPENTLRSVLRVMRIGLAAVVILAAVSVAVLANREGVAEALPAVRWWGIVGALALAVVSAVGEGAALAFLAGDVRPRSVFAMTRAYVAGGFVGSVTPYALGGAPAWLWALCREGVGVGESAAIVLGRSIIAAVFFAVMGLLLAIVAPGTAGLSEAAAFAIIVPIAVIAAFLYAVRRPDRAASAVASAVRALGLRLRSRRLVRYAARAAAEVHEFALVLRDLMTGKPLQMAGALLSVTVSRFAQLLAVPLLLAAQGHVIPLAESLKALIIVWVISSVTPAPSGEGVAQAVVVSVFGSLADPHSAAAAAIVWRATVFYSMFLVGGVLFARLVRGTRKRLVAAGAEGEPVLGLGDAIECGHEGAGGSTASATPDKSPAGTPARALGYGDTP